MIKNSVKSSFKENDVILLLKDITGLIEPLPTEIREKNIQMGVHYSEMLPLEYVPSDEYISIYKKSLKIFGQNTADAVARVSDKIIKKKGKNVVIVSLARAGTPIGILIKRYIFEKYGYDCIHYSISIIRDKGIDDNAIEYILKKHEPESIQFIDGWTGKGVIYKELQKEIRKYNGVSSELAVLADPAYLTDLCGTHDDIMIPSSCLNSTVCGLISRTFYRKDIIFPNDFHGAMFYSDFDKQDRTYEFIDYITGLFKYNLTDVEDKESKKINDVISISKKYQISNINYIKPGIGETTRVLLRRIPWKILINNRYAESDELSHIIQLAKEKMVDVDFIEMDNYKCCGLIKNLSDV